MWKLLSIIIASCALLPIQSRAQDMGDIKDASALMTDLKRTTKKIEKYQEKRKALEPFHFSERWEKRKKEHNDNQCHFDPNVDSHACDWYTKEREELIKTGEKEIAEHKVKTDYYDGQIATARTHIGTILATIRVNRIISGLNCECPQKVDIEAEATCYEVCWDNAMDPGRTIHVPGER